MKAWGALSPKKIEDLRNLAVEFTPPQPTRRPSQPHPLGFLGRQSLPCPLRYQVSFKVGDSEKTVIVTLVWRSWSPFIPAPP